MDEKALVASLNEGSPACAVLDVFDPEPLPQDSPLWNMENVIISPHTSNAGSGTPGRGDKLFVENLRRFLAEEPLLHEADPDLD